MLKTFSLAMLGAAAALTLSAFSAAAQDKIYLNDGTTIEAKVKVVGPRTVSYNRWEVKDGPIYEVERRDVERIVYENGTEESFSRARRAPREVEAPRTTEAKRRPTEPYGQNILSLAPIQMTNESPAGIGVHYERVVDKNGVFSVYLPIAVSFFDDEINNPQTGMPMMKESRVFTYLYPGIKIYPGGNMRRVSYSIGPSFALGFGEKYKLYESLDQNGSLVRRYEEGSVFKAGFLINNGLNIQPTRQLYIGLELGVGISYYDNENDNYTIGNEPLVQFNFKMGYRF